MCCRSAEITEMAYESTGFGGLKKGGGGCFSKDKVDRYGTICFSSKDFISFFSKRLVSPLLNSNRPTLFNYRPTVVGR